MQQRYKLSITIFKQTNGSSCYMKICSTFNQIKKEKMKSRCYSDNRISKFTAEEKQEPGIDKNRHLLNTTFI